MTGMEHLIIVTARIDQDAMLVIAVEEDRAVLLKGRHGDNTGLQLSHFLPTLCFRKSRTSGFSPNKKGGQWDRP